MKTFNNIEILNFSEFLKKVPVKYLDSKKKLYQYNIRLTQEVNDVATYQRQLTNLVVNFPHSKTDLSILKNQLLSQSHLISWFKGDLKEMLTEAIQKYQEKYGDQISVVKMDNRMWLLTKPNFLSLVTNRNKMSLVSYAKDATWLLMIDKITEKEVLQDMSNSGQVFDVEKAVSKVLREIYG